MAPRAIRVCPIDNYRLLVMFETGEIKIYDVKPLIKGDWFGALKDKNYFKTVHIAGLSVEWDDGQDVCPDDLYDSSVPLTEDYIREYAAQLQQFIPSQMQNPILQSLEIHLQH